MCDVRNYSTVSPVLVVAVMVFILWTLTNIGLYYDCSPRAPALEVARLLASAAGVLALGIFLSRYIILCKNIYSFRPGAAARHVSLGPGGGLDGGLVGAGAGHGDGGQEEGGVRSCW